MGYYTCYSDRITITKTISLDTITEHGYQIALEMSKEVFEQFQWYNFSP